MSLSPTVRSAEMCEYDRLQESPICALRAMYLRVSTLSSGPMPLVQATDLANHNLEGSQCSEDRFIQA